VAHFEHPRNVLAYGAARWCRARGVPIVYTWLGPFHDRYLIDDREQPYEERPHYERLIFSRRELLRRLMLDVRPVTQPPKSNLHKILDHYRNYWLHWPLAQADALLPCSEHEATIMRKMGLRQPMTVVPLWINGEELSVEHGALLNSSRPAVLYIGQLTRRKCYDLMVEAMPQVLARYPTATFLFVSHNPEQRAHMLALAAERGVAERLRFLGRLSDAELQALYRAVDLYAFPSRYEGFGLPLLEAMAAGCPVVTTNIPVLDELVCHGENGWLVRYNNAVSLAEGICALLGDPALRARLVEGGRRTLRERFDETRLVARIEAVFNTTTAEAQRRREGRG
jgi:glycosyltransferase involved in cell wall biosynthesis